MTQEIMVIPCSIAIVSDAENADSGWQYRCDGVKDPLLRGIDMDEIEPCP